MKKFRFFIVASLMVFFVVLMSVSAAAADNVIFIKDGGTGDGSSADKALANGAKFSDPSVFDTSSYQSSSFYLAIDKLKNTGGTIVVCGPYTIDRGSNGSPDYCDFIVPFIYDTTDDTVITITSVYNGVDYRNTADAKLIIDRTGKGVEANARGVNLNIRTRTNWENVALQFLHNTARTVENVNKTPHISFNGYETVLGATVNVVDISKNEEITYANSEDPNIEYYPTISAGAVDGSLPNKDGGDARKTVSTNLTINDGTYRRVAAGNFGKGEAKNYYIDGDTNLTINGGLFINGVSGTSMETSAIGAGGQSITGNIKIKINGGKFLHFTRLHGGAAMMTNKSEGVLIINGGDFSECNPKYSFFYAASGTAKIPEGAYELAATLIDFSKYDSDIFYEPNLHIYTRFAEGTATPGAFDVAAYPESDEDETTTVAGGTQTTEAGSQTTAESESAAPETTTSKPETTKKAESETVPVKPADPADSSVNIWVYIVIIIAVLIGAAVIIFLVIKKKK